MIAKKFTLNDPVKISVVIDVASVKSSFVYF